MINEYKNILIFNYCIMEIIDSEVYSVDLINHAKKYYKHTNHDLMLSKDQHYYLLAYLSTKIDNKTIIDIGTHHGTSACSLAYNPTNKIITYDLCNNQPYHNGGIVNNFHVDKLNIEWNLCNIMNEESEKQKLLTASLIMLDTAHTGDFETEVYMFLKNNSYKGILILDDIHYNNQMKDFWNNIDISKKDITHIGHKECSPVNGEITGTGIVDFTNTLIF